MPRTVFTKANSHFKSRSVINIISLKAQNFYLRKSKSWHSFILLYILKFCTVCLIDTDC